MERKTEIPAHRRPVSRRITVDPACIHCVNTLPDGSTVHSKYWMEDGILLHRNTHGHVTKCTATTALLREMLNNNR